MQTAIVLVASAILFSRARAQLTSALARPPGVKPASPPCRWVRPDSTSRPKLANHTSTLADAISSDSNQREFAISIAGCPADDSSRPLLAGAETDHEARRYGELVAAVQIAELTALVELDRAPCEPRVEGHVNASAEGQQERRSTIGW
jgi:hypothetical protein